MTKIKKYFKKFRRASRGITLIEIMVATALFSIVMLISVGSITAINDANKKAQLTRTVMDNLNFAMENMARNLRVGTTYHCGATGSLTAPLDCPSGEKEIAFEGYRGSSSNPDDQIIYRLNTATNQIERSVDSGANYIVITSPELTIESLSFYVTGTASGDGKQPRVVISISGSATFKAAVSTFKVQTSVSQRRLDS